ncbi:hypothetical protein AGLY_008575 [Aphis glycines]|uniref:Uncharacterized protein n=1 Tax=Aphis glycines TaxID=307491 RepID=A0A6G0TKE7_APHGL|nr:hypothetical protein AGLY_008575 [Aphis glycines]
MVESISVISFNIDMIVIHLNKLLITYLLLELIAGFMNTLAQNRMNVEWNGLTNRLAHQSIYETQIAGNLKCVYDLCKLKADHKNVRNVRLTISVTLYHVVIIHMLSQLIGQYLDFEIECMTETEHNFKLNCSYIAFYPIILIMVVSRRLILLVMLSYKLCLMIISVRNSAKATAESAF